jgi:hypothetical protein
MIFKKSESTPGGMTYAEAVERYEQAAGLLFEKPVKKHCKYEKNAWLLFNREAALVAIVSDDSVLFGANIRGAMQQLAESWAK